MPLLKTLIIYSGYRVAIVWLSGGYRVATEWLSQNPQESQYAYVLVMQDDLCCFIDDPPQSVHLGQPPNAGSELSYSLSLR